MEGSETPQRTAARKAADGLQALARIDTVFADLYLLRARELLATHLGEADFRALSRAQTEADLLPDRIRGAMGIQDWKVVQELSGRLAGLKRRLADSAELRAVAQRVYEFEDLVLDPFSPGLRALAGVGPSGLPALREQGLRLLEQVRASDPAWTALYESRAQALRALPVEDGEVAAVQGDRPSDLEAEAMDALARGDLRKVQELSARLLAGAPGGSASTPAGRRPVPTSRSLAHVFPDEVIRRARALGLAPVHLDSIEPEFEEIFRHAWQPRPAGAEGVDGGPVRISLAVPSEFPPALRDHLEMYLDRPFVNSAGARYLPPPGDEDLLVEDFDEPAPGAAPANPALLELLGLPERSGLSRTALERALRANGHRAVEQAGLDSRAFRLVCVPADVYVRVGVRRGWGSQPRWTHLDGCMLQNRRWLVLAGGDTRFGGVFDLVGLGRDNDLENLVARFAIVSRRRLSAWPDVTGSGA